MESMEALTEAVAERLFIELEASGRHVHLTKEQSLALFGHSLTEKRPLSQPGQFLSQERLAVIGPRGSFRNVAVLGPERKEGQVEISLTDCRHLGIEAPLRLSGDIKGSPGIRLEGPGGAIMLSEGVIVAKRHIHLTPEKARQFGVRDRQIVSLKTYTSRPCVFEDVAVRVSEDFAPYVHLDLDEANACGFRPGDLGRILP